MALVFDDDALDEYSDEERQLEEDLREEFGSLALRSNGPMFVEEVMLSPEELQLTDPMQPEFEKTPQKKLLTCLDLNKMYINDEEKFANPFYRRPSYKDAYASVVEFLENTFVTSEHPSCLATKFMVDQPNIIYEFLKASQPCIYFTVSLDTAAVYSSQDMYLARWSCLLKTTIDFATVVKHIVDNSKNPSRIVYWIKIDISGIPNPFYTMSDPVQLQSLYSTTDIYKIVTEKLNQRDKPSSLVQPLEESNPAPKKRIRSRFKLNDGAKNPNLPIPESISVPPNDHSPQPPTTTTQESATTTTFQQAPVTTGSQQAPTTTKTTQPVKRNRVSRISMGAPKVIEEKPVNNSAAKRKGAQLEKEEQKKQRVAKMVPLPEGETSAELEKDKKKIFNCLVDLVHLYRLCIPKIPTKADQNEQGESLDDINKTIQAIAAKDEADELDEDQMDSQMVDISYLMDNDQIQKNIRIKKEALQHALICWVKVEAHNYLISNRSLLLSDDLLSKIQSPAKSIILSTLEGHQVQPMLKQTRRHARLAKVFPYAFISFMLQATFPTPKKPPAKDVIQRTKVINACDYILQQYEKHGDIKSKAGIQFNEVAPDHFESSEDEYVRDVYWVWSEDQEENSGIPIHELDPKKYILLELSIHNQHGREFFIVIVCSIHRRKTEKTILVFFLQFLNFTSTTLSTTIPKAVIDGKAKFDKLINNTEPMEVTSRQMLPSKSTNFFFWFITGTTLEDPFPNNKSTTAFIAPLSELVRDIRSNLFRQLMLWAKIYEGITN